jgi:hypothetical protein
LFTSPPEFSSRSTQQWRISGILHLLPSTELPSSIHHRCRILRNSNSTTAPRLRRPPQGSSMLIHHLRIKRDSTRLARSRVRTVCLLSTLLLASTQPSFINLPARVYRRLHLHRSLLCHFTMPISLLYSRLRCPTTLPRTRIRLTDSPPRRICNSVNTTGQSKPATTREIVVRLT